MPNAFAASAKVDPTLSRFAYGKSDSQAIRVFVLLINPNPKQPLPRRYDRAAVLSYLHQRLKESFKPVGVYLRAKGAFNQSVRKFRYHAINNAFSAEVSPNGLRTLAQTPGVKKIYANHRVENEPMRGHLVSASKVHESPREFQIIGLDRIIEEFPKIDGSGILLGHVDSGVDASHPALKNKIVGFYNSETKKNVEPFDSDIQGHGTHTAGTMVGGDRSNMLIGMAPGAKLLCAGNLDSLESQVRGLEFMMQAVREDSPGSFPRAVNNSWNTRGAPDQEPFYRAISALEGAGILPVFSVGNEGAKGPRSVTPPHEHPLALTIGAVGPDEKIARMSSQGPAIFKGKEIQKPELVAPGIDIRSSVPDGKFGEMSGTSMASPHVTGAIALLLQADPALKPSQIRMLLTKTATPVSENGSKTSEQSWNKLYGFGILNIYSAVKQALSVHQRRTDVMRGLLDLKESMLTSPDELELQQYLDPMDEPWEEEPSASRTDISELEGSWIFL